MSSPVSSWTVEDVAQFISRLSGLSDDGGGSDGPQPVAQRFREAEIGGIALLHYARDHRDLVVDLGLSIGKAIVLWEAIRELANRDRGVAASPVREGGAGSAQGEPSARAAVGDLPAVVSEGVPPSATVRPAVEVPGEADEADEAGSLLGVLEQMFPRSPSAEGSLVLELQQMIPSTAAAPMGHGQGAHELRRLKLSVLKKQARAAGVPERLLEEADDSDAPKDSVVRLLLAASGAPSPILSTNTGGSAELRKELGALKMSALKKRARAQGIDEANLEEAEDADAPREAIIDLIVATTAGSSEHGDSARRQQELRDELKGLKLSALKKHAYHSSSNHHLRFLAERKNLYILPNHTNSLPRPPND